ncbi:hypothetical protein KM176_24190 [Pseudooceanicola sp. CBS1P-1]|uniref:Uncharacterized protein n=1 Tax=Pseudooceanicola albus TaxID=2692189 RepID=A0A6L7GC68_9RHOB|nr:MULTISPECIES: hypothetical protein [Pseudooceanicola]MBT9386962.1 hypothetical protein [Pseudooceanicola endophyticus]MXN21187.1 hypothetical protein [Pseudooceanicola albus]
MFTLKLDPAAFGAATLDLQSRGVQQAAAWALTDTAQDVLEHVQARMDVVFDKPTRFTKNAFMVWRAKPGDLEASVIERPSVGRRHYLKLQETGGARGQTGLEKLLDSRLAYAGALRSVIPASGAKLNAYGNWQVGERNQALSAVQAQRDATANTTEAARKRNRKRAGFFVPRAGSKLSPGIWKRDGAGRLTKVVHFTALAPHYDRRLGFFDGAEEVRAARLPVHLKRTLAKAVERAARAGG